MGEGYGFAKRAKCPHRGLKDGHAKGLKELHGRGVWGRNVSTGGLKEPYGCGSLHKDPPTTEMNPYESP